MNQAYRVSFLSVLAVIFLLPIFFLPASILPLGSAKIALLALGAVVALLALFMEILKFGEFKVPSHYVMWGAIALPLVYLLTALVGTDREMSLFGYGFDVGTFAYILLASVLFAVTAYVFTDTSRVLRALGVFLISMALLAIFAVVKLLTGGSFPVWGVFDGVMANPVGAWTDYAIVFSLTAVLSAMAISIMPLARPAKIFAIALFALSTALMVITNFSAAFVLSLAAAIVVSVYLYATERRANAETDGTTRKVTLWPSITLAVVSLLFIINPVVSSTWGQIGSAVSGAFGINNVEVRPSLSSTYDITTSVLKEDPVFGSGPNTFGQSWLTYKPAEVNNTVFWNVGFPFGFGFIPTQVASTGLVGTIVWLLFFTFLILLAARAMAMLPKDKMVRFSVISTGFTTIFLWAASFMYVPSVVVLTLTFIFTGLFVAASAAAGIVPVRVIGFSHRAASNFAAMILVIALGIGMIALGFNAFQRTAAAYHFQKAIVLSNTEGSAVADIESELAKAIRLKPHDIYYSALSNLNVARAQSAINATTGTAEENRAAFQSAISNSIAAAQAAVSVNRNNYGNWVNLGSIYASLVPAPFSVEGAYESAQEAYMEAKRLNPTSPQIPLLLARLELSNSNATQARAYIDESLALKQDYADAYFLLAQLEVANNNLPAAIRSAEALALLSPDNAGIFFQLGLLKYNVSDWQGAGQAFARAIQIVPDYANAKYFLGLTLNELGETEAAIAQFESLIQTNPDNTELPLILENLRAGREPLAGIPGANNPPPEDRETPPIPAPTSDQ